MSKRKTFAEIREEASASARVAAIEECCRVLKHYVGSPEAAEKLYSVMSSNEFRAEPKRERANTAWYLKTTPDEYFGTN